MTIVLHTSAANAKLLSLYQPLFIPNCTLLSGVDQVEVYGSNKVPLFLNDSVEITEFVKLSKLCIEHLFNILEGILELTPQDALAILLYMRPKDGSVRLGARLTNTPLIDRVIAELEQLECPCMINEFSKNSAVNQEIWDVVRKITMSLENLAMFCQTYLE